MPSVIPTPRRTVGHLKRRLAKAGLSPDFVRCAILPDWWEKTDDSDAALLPEIEFAVARFLGTPLERIQDPAAELQIPDMGAKLRRPKNVASADLTPCVFAAVAVAKAALRNLKRVAEYHPLPPDPLAWRAELLEENSGAVTLRTIVENLWHRGIPVLHVQDLPSPKFRGLACCVEGRPVVVLAYGGSEAPKFLIDIAHEAGHIACGHVVENAVTVDVEESADGDADEREANIYYQKVLLGASYSQDNKRLQGTDADVKQRVVRIARESKIDSGLIAHFWASATGQHHRRARLLSKLEKLDGHRVLYQATQEHLELDAAPETDANVLRCIVRPTEDASRGR